MLYQIFHIYDVDGGFGDPIEQTELVATVEATEEQIAEFIKTWDKPRVYERPFGALYEHHVIAKPVEVCDINGLVPYDPETRDWPSLPKGVSSISRWDGKKWVKTW